MCFWPFPPHVYPPPCMGMEGGPSAVSATWTGMSAYAPFLAVVAWIPWLYPRVINLIVTRRGQSPSRTVVPTKILTFLIGVVCTVLVVLFSEQPESVSSAATYAPLTPPSEACFFPFPPPGHPCGTVEAALCYLPNPFCRPTVSYEPSPEPEATSEPKPWPELPQPSRLLKTIFERLSELASLIIGKFLALFSGDACAGTSSDGEEIGEFQSVAVSVWAMASIFAIAISGHYTIQFVKAIAPGPFGFISTFVMYQPVFWGIIFSLGYIFPFPFGGILNQLQFQWQHNRFFVFFLALASFKAFKGFVHIMSFYFYTRPAKSPRIPTVTPRDVSVIVSTVGSFEADFQMTVQSILLNQPRELIIATVGVDKAKKAQEAIQDLPRALVGSTIITVDLTMAPNKRSQFISAVGEASGDIICYADDHVLWPTTFLKSALAPFEDAHVGMVGTVKAVERVRTDPWVSFLNYVGCIYLERHNFECTATYNIDGGVFVISGRTGLIRKQIVESRDFRKGFLNEKFKFLLFKSDLMKPDDDNFMTRYCVKNEWKTVFHNHPDACVGTTLGVDKDASGSRKTKFLGQLVRWARTTWRSNLVSLFVDRSCWRAYPWTTYAMFISSFINLAIIYDPLMLVFLYLSRPQTSHFWGAVVILFLSKCVKPIQFMWKHPRDLVWLFWGILFGYLHSLIRLYALFTITNVEWSGRQLNSAAP